jgi:hypothetical protein
VDKDKKAQEKAATVEVKVSGVKLIDPAMMKEQPKEGQGHLHYQVDSGSGDRHHSHQAQLPRALPRRGWHPTITSPLARRRLWK